MPKANNKLFLIPALLLLAMSTQAWGQQSTVHQRTIQWNAISKFHLPNDEVVNFATFESATFDQSSGWLPKYTEVLPVNKDGQLAVSLENVVYEDFEQSNQIKDIDKLSTVIEIESYFIYVKGKPKVIVKFIPARVNPTTRQYERITSFQLRVNISGAALTGTTRNKRPVWANTSVLSSGEWFKIAVVDRGVHRVDSAFLAATGVNLQGVNVDNIQLYGNGGGMLPQPNADDRIDDLAENAIEMVDLNNNKVFNSNDYFLFYGEPQLQWEYSSSDNRFHRLNNFYSDTTYYFVHVGSGPGKRIPTQTSLADPPSQVVTSFDDYFLHEEDKKNLIKSGRAWFGEEFDKVLDQSVDVSIPNLITSEDVYINSVAVARSINISSAFNVSVNGNNVLTHNISSVPPDYSAAFTPDPIPVEATFTASSGNFNVNYSYNKPRPLSVGWLNYFELNYRRSMDLVGSQMHFRDSRTVGNAVTEFQLSTTENNIRIWDVSDRQNVKEQQTSGNGSQYTFRVNTDDLHEFIAFSSQQYFTPRWGRKISNQNLHAINQADYVIVTHPLFISQAERLANFHEERDNLSTVIVTPQQLYNEFSSGSQDITAIRDFMKMLYDKAPTPEDRPKYLLLFGDASYDYKDRIADNTNKVPAYQSTNSYSPTASYVSDDYYGFLDDTEGAWLPSREEGLDIGIGRFPVNTPEEASAIVDKVVRYKASTSFGDWRNRIAFFADDEDFNLHINDAESLVPIIDTSYKAYNIDKVYFDAYERQTTSFGSRYPEVNEEFSRVMDQGALIVNYTGHGGELGLAHEKVLEIPEILSWDNQDHMPIFITATCEFTRYDDPGRTSAGEYTLINPNGGAIALFSTVRLVFAWPNFILNKNMYLNNAFARVDNQPRTMGEIIQNAKNVEQSYNSRNFSLLGDPALTLNYPEHNVVTTHINSQPVSTTADTIKALSKVTIRGAVVDTQGDTLTNFNGTVIPTIFDKAETYKTLANNPERSSEYSFELQNSVIYKGRASVTNGIFTFNFIVPKDISYRNGFGKISYYAFDNNTDAQGFYENLVIGGTADSVSQDEQGPEITLFMNDESFVFGGLTDQSPDLFAIIRDEHGINTVGNGIGRELTAVLDGDLKNVHILNDYYEAKMDSYQEGEIRYPFSDLSEGPHTLKLKVWDVYNNPSEAYTEFIVSSSEELAIQHVLNYPNPFSTNTTFHFDHNKTGNDLEVQIQIFTVSGKLIKTLFAQEPAADSHFDKVTWNARDEYGDKLARGVYVYKVKVRSSDGDKTEKFEKLVILN